MAPINFSEEPNVTCLQYDGYLRLQANRDIKCGEIIVQAKSVACNSSVFLNSGFITSKNQANNKIEFEAELDQNDPLYIDKKSELKQDAIKRKFNLHSSFSHVVQFEVLSWLRYIVLNTNKSTIDEAKSIQFNAQKQNYLKYGGNNEADFAE